MARESLQGTAPFCATYYASASAGAASAISASLPAMGAQMSHNIVKLEFVRFCTATAVSAAAPFLITTTNLRGVQFCMGSASASGGDVQRWVYDFNPPLVALSANAATTFQIAGDSKFQWYVNCWYF